MDVVWLAVPVILLQAFRNESLSRKLKALTQARPVSGEIKYPLSLEHLQQIANDAVQIFGEAALMYALFGVKRTLRKLMLNEDFIREQQLNINMMHLSLDRALRRKGVLEAEIKAVGNTEGFREELDRVDNSIMHLTTGLERANRLMTAWKATK